MANRRSLALRRNDASAPLRPGLGFSVAYDPLDNTADGFADALQFIATGVTVRTQSVPTTGGPAPTATHYQRLGGTLANGSQYGIVWQQGTGGAPIAVPGRPYTWAVAVKAPTWDPDVTVRVSIDWRNATDAAVGTPPVTTYTPTTSWTYVQVSGTAPVGAAYLRLTALAVATGAGVITVDFGDLKAWEGAKTQASEWDSALRSDFTYIPEDLDPPSAILYARDVSHTAVEVAFDPLSIPVDPNFGAPKEIALVRSPSGFPATLLDGNMVRRHPPEPPDNEGWVRIPDTGLTPGTWYYYGLFGKYFSEGNTFWLRVGEKSVLLPAEYLSADHLWERIPEWYRRQDMEPGNVTGTLRRLIDTVGYMTDTHRTWAYTVGDVWDAEKISSDLLPYLGDTLGQPVEYAAGDERYRALLSNILPLRKLKGTERGTEAYISAITGYRTRVYSGLNLLPTIDEAEAKYTSGLWQQGGSSTVTRVLSTGAATPGPAAGRYYHRLTFNGSTLQQPWMQVGNVSNLSTLIPVEAGHQYIASAFYRSSFVGTLVGWVVWYSATGAQIGAEDERPFGSVGTAWKRDATTLFTAPAGAAFAEFSIGLSQTTNVNGIVIEATEILFGDTAWRPEDVPGSANTPPLSGTNPGEYDDVNYYEPPRTVHVNVYPQRINYALNSLFSMDNIPAGAWTVAERATWGLLKQAYDSWGDIHDAQIGDSEADWGDLAEGFEPLAGDWSITFDTNNQRLIMIPAGAPAHVAQVQSGFVPVVPGDSISAAFISWGSVDGVQLTLAVQFYTDDAPQYILSIDGVSQDIHGAAQTMTTTPYRYELRNAVIPEGAAYARVVVETRHTVAYNAYLAEALIENAQIPGTYFNGDEVDGAYGDFFFIGQPHESYSVYYQNYRSFINDAGGSDRITSLMDELLPMETDFVLRTAAFGLY